jgi:hypothetical protein
MTLVLAHRDGWMIADQGQQCNDHKIPSTVDKIFLSACQQWLWATAGDAIVGQLIRHALNTEKDTVEQVSNIMQNHKSEHCIALGLSRDHQIVRVDCHGYVSCIRPTQDYYAIGLADTEAMAFMAGWKAHGGELSVNQGIAALMYSNSIYPVIDTAHTIHTFGDRE